MEKAIVKTEYFEMNYIKFGEGKKTMVILPGVSLQPIRYIAAAVAATYKIFTEDYTVYLFDRREDYEEGMTIKMAAEDTAQAMIALGLKDVYLLGISQGGMMAQCIAAAHPELVKKMVLGSTNSKSNEETVDIISHWVQLAREHRIEELNWSSYERLYTESYRTEYAQVFEQMAKKGTPEECDRFVIMASSIIPFDILDDLVNIKCGTLVIGAENDHVTTARSARETAELLGCELYIYPGFYHAAYDEAKDYQQRVKEFFDRG